MYHREIVYHVVETWIHTKTTARNKLKFEMESTHTHSKKNTRNIKYIRNL